MHISINLIIYLSLISFIGCLERVSAHICTAYFLAFLGQEHCERFWFLYPRGSQF